MLRIRREHAAKLARFASAISISTILSRELQMKLGMTDAANDNFAKNRLLNALLASPLSRNSLSHWYAPRDLVYLDLESGPKQSAPALMHGHLFCFGHDEFTVLAVSAIAAQCPVLYGPQSN